MKLYYAPGACSLASHIALIEGGGEFEAVRVDLSKHRTEHDEDFYAISPRGYVPAIVNRHPPTRAASCRASPHPPPPLPAPRRTRCA